MMRNLIGELPSGQVDSRDLGAFVSFEKGKSVEAESEVRFAISVFGLCEGQDSGTEREPRNEKYLPALLVQVPYSGPEASLEPP